MFSLRPLSFFSTENIALTLWGYDMSYSELIGMVFGIGATVLAAMRITLTWLVNLVGVVFFAIVTYQLKLYADLILQSYYFVMGVLGWLWWNKKAENYHIPVTYWRPGIGIYLLSLVGLVVATAIMGYLVSNFNVWMPQWFPEAAVMPYPNAAILVISVTGTFLMSKRRIECWWLWAINNPLAAWIYWQQESLLFTIVFIIFWIIGLSGWYAWVKEYKKEKQQKPIAAAN